MTSPLRCREEVDTEETWDVTHIFASIDAWEASYRAVERELPDLARFRGRLGESAEQLWEWLQVSTRISITIEQILSFANLQFDVDTTNQTYAALLDRARNLLSRFRSATAFAHPELVALEPATIEQFLEQQPALVPYRHFFDELARLRGHVRSAEVEQVVAQASNPLMTALATYEVLADGELRFAPAIDVNGTAHRITTGTIDELLTRPDPVLRRSAWESYADGFLSVKNSMAALLLGNFKTNIFHAQVHRYPSAHAAALAEYNIPVEVYETIIDTCLHHLPLWHRYWEVLRRVQGTDTLHIADIFAPITTTPISVPYAQAVTWICEGLAPLGAEYVNIARAGLTSERWVDIYPNHGKRGGAYSAGAYGNKPSILLNYTNDIDSLSTLAHELGHSMHTYLTNQHQPFCYSNYSMFVAEVASNFHQALVRAFLLQQSDDRDFQLAILQEAMGNFHRYLFLMPILAKFELLIHQRLEQHEAPTADEMSQTLLEWFRLGYGPRVGFDDARMGITWAQFPHFYANFYVYQYASGIAAATVLAERVLSGPPQAAEAYLSFLKAGNSLYPIEALKLAGIDMSSPEPMNHAFRVLGHFIERLELLVA